jgi:hypothetical protein
MPDSGRPGRRFIRPMFVEGRYLNHPYYDPLWAELERLQITAAVHATPGLWNPEWTSHGPFFEKIKDRLVQPALPDGGGGPFAGGSSGAPGTTTFTGATPLGHPLAPILAYWLFFNLDGAVFWFPAHQRKDRGPLRSVNPRFSTERGPFVVRRYAKPNFDIKRIRHPRRRTRAAGSQIEAFSGRLRRRMDATAQARRA